MVYGIIKNHGGDIKVYSNENKGTVFHIYLPRSLSDTFVIPAFSKKTYLDKIVTLNTVLVIEDEQLIREFLTDLLKSINPELDILTANNGEEGVAAYKANKDSIDCIILDLIMPVMDGIGAFKAIRALSTSVPILFSSGYSESPKIIELRQSGHVEFIQKPYLIKDLIEKINMLWRS